MRTRSMSQLKLFLFALLCFGGTTLFSNACFAQTAATLYMTNDTGGAASCVRFTVDGAGGDLTVNPNLVYPYPPMVSITHNGNQATVTLDWGQLMIAKDVTVACVLQTNNGPLTFVNGVWCTGVNSNGTVVQSGPVSIPPGVGGGTTPWTGPGGGMGPMPPMPPPVGGSCKCKLEIKKRDKKFRGRSLYSIWFIGPPRFEHRSFCWYRICCRPKTKKQIRFDWVCYSVDDTGKLGGEKSRKKLTKWITVGYSGGKYKLDWQSWKPRGYVFPIPFPFLATFGPPKDLSTLFVKEGVGMTEFDTDVFDFVAKEQYFVQSTDAATSFQQLSGALVPQYTLDERLPSPASFEEMINLYSVPYASGAKLMANLSSSLQSELTNASAAELHAIQKDIKSVSRCLNRISQALGSGKAPSAYVLSRLSRDFGDLAAQVQIHGDRTGNARMAHVADSFKEAAANMNFAARQVSTGLRTVGERDDFMWAMFTGLSKNMADVGTSFRAHVRVHFEMSDYVWHTGTIHGAAFRATNADGDIVDEIDLQVSDRGFVTVPIDQDSDDDKLLMASLKLPTVLSAATMFSNSFDGIDIKLGELTLGDVDDDNCVTDKDFEAVLKAAEKAAGGQFAESVPATDVDGNGQVDLKDLEIVSQNLGKCGEGR